MEDTPTYGVTMLIAPLQPTTEEALRVITQRHAAYLAGVTTEKEALEDYEYAVPALLTRLAEPAIAGWLHLPSLHAKLLPLALAAGHERLTLSLDYEGSDDFQCTYSAHGSGGQLGSRFYITPFDLNGGHLPDRFEQVLTEKLQHDADFLAAKTVAA